MTKTDALEAIGFDDLEVGDEVMIHNAAGRIKGVIVQAGYGNNVVARIPVFGVDYTLYRETDHFFLIRRPLPLPDVPGTVGLATINGRRVRVMLCQDAQGMNWWACSSPIAAGDAVPTMVPGDRVSDFERLDVMRDGKLA